MLLPYCITGSCLACYWCLLLLAALQSLLACYWCLLLPTALQVRALLVLACVILIPYERTCIEVLTGACCCLTALQSLLACYWCLLLPYCITGSCLAAALLHYRLVMLAAALLHYSPCLLVTGACCCLLHYGFVPCWCLLV